MSIVVEASVAVAFNLTAPAPAFLPVTKTTSLLEVILTALLAPVAAISTVPAEFTSTPAEPASITTPASAESASKVIVPVPVVINLTPPLVPVAVNLPPAPSSSNLMLPVSKPFFAHTRPVPSCTLKASI